MAASVSKRRPVSVFFGALFAIVVYFILFPYPLGRESVARPVWSVPLPLPDTAAAPDAGGTIASFQLGGLFGYVDAEGRFLHTERTLYRVALSEAGFVNFAQRGTNWIFKDPRGGRLRSFSGNGYPLLSGDGKRVFVVKTDLSGIIEVDDSGEVKWARDFPALMTSVALQGDSLLVGLLNGSLLLINGQGSPVFQETPGASRISVILGTAASPDGRLLAALTGIDPQYLTVFRRDGSAVSRLAAEPLASNFRREVRMSFSPDGRFLAVEGEGSEGLFDPSSRAVSWIPFRGSLSGVSFAGHGRYAALVARAGTRAELTILAPFVAPILKETFPARELSIGSVGGALLVGLDGRLLRIDVEEL